MENASKALIIAGAILLAIVIISLGLIVVNNSRNAVDSANLSEQEIQSFNAKFLPYEGENVSGSRVNTLIQQVISTNQATANEGKDNYVCIAFPTSSSSKKKYAICLNNNNKLVATGEDITSGKRTMDIGNSTDSSTTKSVFGYRALLRKDTTDIEPLQALTVSTGGTYKVELGYINGLVQAIGVSEI